VRVDDTVFIRWAALTNRMPKLSLKGDILTLEGQAVRSDGIVAVSATAYVLLLNEEGRSCGYWWVARSPCIPAVLVGIVAARLDARFRNGVGAACRPGVTGSCFARLQL
jgi:hypothetical protein